GRAATEELATLRSRPRSCNLSKFELMAAARTELPKGSEIRAESRRCRSTLKERRTNFVSTPNIDSLKRRLWANGTIPSTWVHFGLSAGRGESETAIRSSPQAAAFSFRKVKRSRGEFFGSWMMKVVSPSRKTQLTVSLSTNAAACARGARRAAFTGENCPSGVMYSICALFLAGLSA